MSVNRLNSTWLMAVTTAPSADAAKKLVRQLVERRLVACGTVLRGGRSTYWWKGAVEEADEAVVLLKTSTARWDDLKRALPQIHPYDVPELIALPIVDGHAPYLEWLVTETSDSSEERKE